MPPLFEQLPFLLVTSNSYKLTHLTTLQYYLASCCLNCHEHFLEKKPIMNFRPQSCIKRGTINWSPFGILQVFFLNRLLILRLAKREILARYRGSMLGIVWAILVPLLLLALYSFVFSVIFTSKWNSTAENKGHFALLLFSGLVLFGIFSEVVNRAPTLMLENVSYIKKVVFPLDILTWVSLVVSLFNAFMSGLVLAVGYFYFIGVPPWTIIYLPLILIPLILWTLGLSWFLSSAGIYIRDLRQFIGLFTNALMFLSPLFYPASAFPESIKSLSYLNPMTLVLEGSKDILFWGNIPDLRLFLIQIILSWLVAWLGYAWFSKTQKGFADVL